MGQYFTKTATEIQTYRFDLSVRYPGQTIDVATVTVPAGITLLNQVDGALTVDIQISGGTAGVTYEIPAHFTFVGITDTEDESIYITISGASTVVITPSDLPNAAFPLLPLEEWRYSLAYHPYHFWQQANSTIPVTSSCNTLVRQYAWQTAQFTGRNEISQAILSAEEKLREWLGYSVAPHYVVEKLPWPRYFDRRFDQHGYQAADGRWKTVQLKEGYLQAAGVETLSPVTAAVTVAYSDTDGDGLNDTFTLSFATAVTDPEEISVYFTSADRLNSEGPGEYWRIRPVQVTIASGLATVRGRSWLLVRPILYEGVSGAAVDPTDSTKFAAALDVYRRYTSAGTSLDTCQAVLIWETSPRPSWACCPTGSTDPAGEAYALARVAIRDARLGIVGIGAAVYDAAAATWSEADCSVCPPDRVLVRYLAGYPTEQGRVSALYRTLIARMAAAELARPICACDTANRELYEWQFDLSRAGGANDEQYSVSGDTLTNPFGTRRGHVYAWRQVMNLHQTRGFAP